MQHEIENQSTLAEQLSQFFGGEAGLGGRRKNLSISCSLFFQFHAQFISASPSDPRRPPSQGKRKERTVEPSLITTRRLREKTKRSRIDFLNSLESTYRSERKKASLFAGALMLKVEFPHQNPREGGKERGPLLAIFIPGHDLGTRDSRPAAGGERETDEGIPSLRRPLSSSDRREIATLGQEKETDEKEEE